MYPFIPLLLAFIFLSGTEVEHNTKEALYNIEVRSEQIYILAEFPWTIRKALLEFEPKLKEASDKEAFHRSLFSYVDANFLLKNTQGKKMQLLSVKEVDHQGHAHQSNFEFYFKGSEFVELQNELFFNISKNHKNHHFVSIRDRIYQLTTSVVAPSFLIN